MIAKRVNLKDSVFYQFFAGHIEDGLKILLAYFNKKGQIVENFCQRWDVDFEMFCKNLFLTVALHDIGKLTLEFQNNIKQGKRSSKYPHAFFGLPILAKIPFDNIENLPLPLFAILGHHTQLYRNIYDSTKIGRGVKYCENDIKTFVNQDIKKIYVKLGFPGYFSFPSFELQGWEQMSREDIFEGIILPYSRKSGSFTVKTKSIFTYLFSLLQLCDDYSSAHFQQFIESNSHNQHYFGSVIENADDFVYDLNLIESEFKSKLFNGYLLRDFQKELAEKASKYSFLFAPCGRGKTEAALYWAYKIKNNLKRDKIVFALPTQVTCNAMYARLIDVYGLGEKNVGLFHSKSLIALKYRLKDNSTFVYDEEASNEEIEFKSYNILKDEVFKGNIFFKPITVTTIDHLVYAMVHGFSQADFACGNLQNAIIIFDEVHYYEKHTLNILLRLFDILRKMRIPHLLMTGTAPEFILKKLRSKYNIIIDEEGLNFQPFTIKKQQNHNIFDEDSVLKSILGDYRSGKRIFVILNQIEWVQKLYANLKEYFMDFGVEPKIILYHSRYIYRDRVQKEKEIKKLVKKGPCILVATQVIEISLDISSDVMYSTIAPPDAIGQRAGRLNRSGRFYKNGFTYGLKLFSVEKVLPYPEQIMIDSWRTFRDGPISYRMIKEVCDSVYSDYSLVKDRTLKEYFFRNILFGNRHSEITYGDDEGRSLKVRDDNFQQVDVVPSRVFSEAEDEVSNKRATWVEYKVRIPLYKLKQDLQEYGEQFNFRKHEQYNILECEYDYNYEVGVQFGKTYKRIAIFD